MLESLSSDTKLIKKKPRKGYTNVLDTKCIYDFNYFILLQFKIVGFTVNHICKKDFNGLLFTLLN